MLAIGAPPVWNNCVNSPGPREALGELGVAAGPGGGVAGGGDEGLAAPCEAGGAEGEFGITVVAWNIWVNSPCPVFAAGVCGGGTFAV